MRKKKWMAMLLAVAMVCMMLPMTAFAAGTIDRNDDTKTYTVSGDYTFGEEIVLDAGWTLYVPEGCSLTIPSGKTLSIADGVWLVNDGEVIVNGTLKSYGLTNFVKDSWPKGQFIIQDGEWYNKNGSVLYVGGSGAGLELVGADASMTAAFVNGALVMTAASGTVVQNADKALSSVLMPDMINRLMILEGATYRVAEGKKLTVPACGELVAIGTLEINGSVVLEPGSEYTLKNGTVITMPDEGDPVTLVSGATTSLPAGATARVGSIVLDAGQAVLELDGSVSMPNGDRITAQGDIVYHSVTITATANEGGSISPSGSVAVEAGQDQTFTIVADDGYQISDVLVDNVSVGAIDSYTFEHVSEAHTIEAVFSHAAVKTPSKDAAGTEVPKTGDNSNMMLWGLLLLAASAGIVGVVLYGRKRAAKD